MKNIILALLMLLMFSNIYSKNSDPLLFLEKNTGKITDTTYKCTVIINSKDKYSDVYLCEFSDSSVRIIKDDVSKKILIKDIHSILFNGRGFMKGAAIGGGIGLVLGSMAGAMYANLGSDGHNDGSFGEAAAFGFAFAVPFSLIGGGLGALFAEDKFYDLSKLDFESKKRKVRYLIKEYSDR